MIATDMVFSVFFFLVFFFFCFLVGFSVSFCCCLSFFRYSWCFLVVFKHTDTLDFQRKACTGCSPGWGILTSQMLKDNLSEDPRCVLEILRF